MTLYIKDFEINAIYIKIHAFNRIKYPSNCVRCYFKLNTRLPVPTQNKKKKKREIFVVQSILV